MGPAEEREGRSGESVVVVATADDAIEVHCHGGRAAVAAILRDLAAAGAATVDAETWLACTAAAHTSSVRVAATRILAQTSTERTAAIALDQLRGAVDRFAATLAAQLREAAASGVLPEVQARVAEVLGRASLGAHLAEPWNVVLAGPPNVGKSSLLNALLGYRRAITFASPGTTRDVVSADAAIGGWPVRLSDTAGVRATDAALEAEGVRRTGTALEKADLVLLVIDSQSGWTATHRELRARTSAPCLFVWNKADLAEPPNGAAPAGDPQGAVSFAVSATRGTGLVELERGISRALVPSAPEPGAPVPLTAEQRAALRRAVEAPTAAECLAALESLTAPADPCL